MSMDSPDTYLDIISYQPRVHRFLKSALESNKLSHAYLFCGAQGAGMQDAAMGLACSLAASTSRMHNPKEIGLIYDNQHPDVRLYEPQGRDGYLIEQTRELMSQIDLSPVMCGWKIYIIQDAHRLNAQTANSLLKTIEEPPDNILFIFIAPAADAVLPTIVSRCQQVPFPAINIETRAQAVQEKSGVSDLEACKIALHITGSVEDSIEYLNSDKRRSLRDFVINTMGDLDRMPVAYVLKAANTWCDLARGCLGDGDEIYDDTQEQEEINKEFLTRSAIAELQKAHKREVASYATSGMIESLVYAELFLRDVLLYNEKVLSGTSTVDIAEKRTQLNGLINTDHEDQVDFVARRTNPNGVLKALDLLAEARWALWRSMTPQLTFEVMLIHIKEALYALGNTR